MEENLSKAFPIPTDIFKPWEHFTFHFYNCIEHLNPFKQQQQNIYSKHAQKRTNTKPRRIKLLHSASQRWGSLFLHGSHSRENLIGGTNTDNKAFVSLGGYDCKKRKRILWEKKEKLWGTKRDDFPKRSPCHVPIGSN